MSTDTAAGTRLEDPCSPLFKDENVKLREELQLTEQQWLKLRHFRFSDWRKIPVNVFPTTILVHRDVAEKKFDLRRCVYITGVDAERLSVFAAPKFCCRKPVNRAAMCPTLYNGYVNIEKCDLKVINSLDVAAEMPANYEKLGCYSCNKRDEERLEGRLFAMACGHYACRSCWLIHCKQELARESGPFSCFKGHPTCTAKLTINHAAPIFNDAVLGMMAEFEWRKKIKQSDKVQCAGCKHWLERNNFYRKVMSCACACGSYTCVRCCQLDHTPLRCKDAAVWSEIRSTADVDEAAAEAAKQWSLTRAQFDECLAPTDALATEQFRKNLRFMRTHDRAHGRVIERYMPMVARMLEMHRVQKIAQRKEMQQISDANYGGTDVNEGWLQLESVFCRALETVGETKKKAEKLHRTLEHSQGWHSTLCSST